MMRIKFFVLLSCFFVLFNSECKGEEFNNHCCATEAFKFFFDKNPDNIKNRLELYKSIGVDVIRTHFFWNEPSEGAEWDTSNVSTWYNVAKNYDFKLKMILCVMQSPPAWVFEKYPDARLIDQNGVSAKNTFNFWYPDLYKVIDEKTAKLFSIMKQLGIIDKMYYVIPDLGPAGEPIYPHTWSTGNPECTFWCYNPTAHKDFRNKMEAKYKNIDEANKIWNTDFKSWDDVKVLQPKTKPGPYWNDVLTWYRDSKREFIKWRIDNVKKYTDKKILIYVPGQHWTEKEWQEAVDSGAGNDSLRIMTDTEFLIDIAAEKNCDIQFTGLEGYQEAKYIKDYVDKKGYKNMRIWGENAGEYGAVEPIERMAKTAISNEYFGIDLQSTNYIMEADGVTPNKVFPKFAEACKMIKLYWSDLRIAISPYDISKSLILPDKVSQEYEVKLVNNSKKVITASIICKEIPEGWTCTPDKSDLSLQVGEIKIVKLNVTSNILENSADSKEYNVAINIKSNVLDKDETFDRLIRISARKKVVCEKLNNAIKIDGDLSDWNLSARGQGSRIIIDENSYDSWGKKDESKDNPVTGILYSGYDSENIYIAAKVNDKHMVGKYSGSGLWQGDCIELWLDTRNKADENDNMPSDPYKFQLVAAPMTENKLESSVYVHRNPDENAAKNLIASVKSKSKLIEENGKVTGYVLELVIPINKLVGLGEIKTGSTMGFNVSICYRDVSDQWHDKIWCGTNKPDAATWGSMIFK
jgi:hypothetical protein